MNSPLFFFKTNKKKQICLHEAEVRNVTLKNQLNLEPKIEF